MRTFGAFALLAGLSAASAAAQTPASDALLACAGTVDDAERLACYDRAAAAASPSARQAAERRAAAAAVAAEQAAQKAEAERVAAFGRGGMRGTAPSTDEEFDTLSATIRAVDYDRERKALVSLDNGQVWRQSSNKVPSAVRPGSRVMLKQGSLGSVRMVLEAPGTQVMWVVRVR